MTFKELKIGQTFDFIDTDLCINSFYHRSTKISPRRYTWETRLGTTVIAHIGTIHVRVFHVRDE